MVGISHTVRGWANKNNILKKKEGIFLHCLKDNGTCMVSLFNALTLSKTGLCSNTFRMRSSHKFPPWLLTLYCLSPRKLWWGWVQLRTHPLHTHLSLPSLRQGLGSRQCIDPLSWTSCQVYILYLCVCVCILFVDFNICIVFISYITHTHKYRCSSYFLMCT
jgi:hypothetical protein